MRIEVKDFNGKDFRLMLRPESAAEKFYLDAVMVSSVNAGAACWTFSGFDNDPGVTFVVHRADTAPTTYKP